MELKLRENRHKEIGDYDHWELLELLKEEVVELEDAMYSSSNPDEVRKEAADVANFALLISMIADQVVVSDVISRGE